MKSYYLVGLNYLPYYGATFFNFLFTSSTPITGMDKKCRVQLIIGLLLGIKNISKIKAISIDEINNGKVLKTQLPIFIPNKQTYLIKRKIK